MKTNHQDVAMISEQVTYDGTTKIMLYFRCLRTGDDCKTWLSHSTELSGLNDIEIAFYGDHIVVNIANNVNLFRAGNIAKVNSKIEKAMEKMTEVRGASADNTDYMMRVLEALKINHYVTYKDELKTTPVSCLSYRARDIEKDNQVKRAQNNEARKAEIA